MKTLMRYYCVIILLIVNFACTDKELTKEDEKDIVIKKDDVLPLIENKTWGLMKIEKQVGTGNRSELPSSSEYTAYKTQCSFVYSSGFVGFYSGNESTSDSVKKNHNFPAYARTFSIFTRIVLPVGLDYHWDDTAGTMVTHCYDGTKILQIPVDQIAHLEKASLILYKTMEEAQASKIPENITFIAQENESSGVVTYYYSFRPVYPYKFHTTQWENDSFVMF
ncbi:hypothetical protein [Dyadobacter frigoris]|uniref:Uncharacterized protein n=1 Tax=Dyadobacter frigoris TaxID=2576211 RepID=A0A4U6D771_9BACT|nr:hypothetical protein [Dyadobacter frigoris]TKT92335.1 hypothetical protein FDK13_10170 [Dyadobacter frigoris]GLU53520.1 hypothetical protein Dfri01_29810 [Dyadobacter frigoris]